MKDISQLNFFKKTNGTEILHQHKVELPRNMKAVWVCQAVRFGVYEFRVVPIYLVSFSPPGLGKRLPRCKKGERSALGLLELQPVRCSKSTER